MIFDVIRSMILFLASSNVSPEANRSMLMNSLTGDFSSSFWMIVLASIMFLIFFVPSFGFLYLVLGLNGQPFLDLPLSGVVVSKTKFKTHSI